MMKKILSLLVVLIAANTVFASAPETLYWETKNGTRVVFYQTMDVPMVDMTIAFAAGSAYDGDAFGLSALTTSLLKQGSSGMSATQIAEKLADTGAQFDNMSSKDMVVLNLRTLTSNDAMQKSTHIFKSIINHPDFSQNAFLREKNQQIMSITQAQESPDEVATKLFYQALYKNHPYAHPIAGDAPHLNRLRINQVRDFYHRFFVSKNALIVFVGAIDKATAERLAEELTHDLAQGQAAPKIPMAQALATEIDIEVPFPSSQTILRLGQLGITHKDANYFPLMVGNYIFGGGSLVSRLAKELREQNGLTYGVSSQFAPMPGNGPFVIGLSTKNKQKKLALDMIRSSLSNFIKTGPSNEELIAAKQYLTGSFPLSLGSNSSMASMLLKISFYDLPKDYLNTYVDHINAVTAEEIQAAFQALVIPDKLLQISVGKQAS